MVANGQIKKWIQLLIATGLMAIETGTDKNAINICIHFLIRPFATMLLSAMKIY